MRAPSKKRQQIYLTISETDAKAKAYKKSKTQKCIQWHMAYIYMQ